jgi:hypothetical protein
VVFRILPHKFRAKASSEGPSGKRALPHKPSRKGRRTFRDVRQTSKRPWKSRPEPGPLWLAQRLIPTGDVYLRIHSNSSRSKSSRSSSMG